MAAYNHLYWDLPLSWKRNLLSCLHQLRSWNPRWTSSTEPPSMGCLCLLQHCHDTYFTQFQISHMEGYSRNRRKGGKSCNNFNLKTFLLWWCKSNIMVKLKKNWIFEWIKSKNHSVTYLWLWIILQHEFLFNLCFSHTIHSDHSLCSLHSSHSPLYLPFPPEPFLLHLPSEKNRPHRTINWTWHNQMQWYKVLTFISRSNKAKLNKLV